MKTSKPKGVLAKKGIDPPKALCKGVSTKSLTQNLNTNKAHRPYIILGTAANNSIIKDNGTLTFGGAISERNMAIPRLIGTPIATAKAELIKVPMI